MKLYWLLCAGLLLAGTVEAGQPAQCEWVLERGHLRNSCELLEIDPGVNPILQNASFLACYQRMREAMTAMDAFLKRREIWTDDRVYSAMKLWDAVMKDCVK